MEFAARGLCRTGHISDAFMCVFAQFLQTTFMNVPPATTTGTGTIIISGTITVAFFRWTLLFFVRILWFLFGFYGFVLRILWIFALDSMDSTDSMDSIPGLLGCFICHISR